MQPAFTLQRIASYGDRMVETTLDEIAAWADGDELVVDEMFASLTLRILTRSLFMIDIERGDTDDVIGRAAAVFNEQLEPGNLSLLLLSWGSTQTNR